MSFSLLVRVSVFPDDKATVLNRFSDLSLEIAFKLSYIDTEAIFRYIHHKLLMHQAMKKEEIKPTIIEAHVDPFEPPMPPKVEMEFVKEVAESFAKGQPYAKRIGLTLFRDQVHNILKNRVRTNF